MPKPRSSGSRRTSSNKSGKSFKQTRSQGAGSSGSRVKKGRTDDTRNSGGRTRSSGQSDERNYGQTRQRKSSGTGGKSRSSKSEQTNERGKQYSSRPRTSKFASRAFDDDNTRNFGGRTRSSGQSDERNYGQSRQRKSSGTGGGSRSPKSERTNERGKQYSPKPRTSKFGGRSFDDRDDRRGRKKSESFQGKRPVKGRKVSAEPEEAPAQTEKIRLNRYIANSGVCSRREADELITMGLISVNGVTITELGYKVNPGDEVRYESKVLRAEKPVYILLNKPKGYLTTTRDPEERKTVMNLIGGKIKERIYPVGRLDRNTTGLLLLTNDGDLADKLMHPSYNVKKIYKVELDRPLSQPDLEKIREGVMLEEGRAMVDDAAIVSPDGRTVGLEIHIGWNRVVRRIFETLGYEVMKLDRTVYAGLDKKDLPRGEWRHLRKEEIVRLKHYK